MPENAPNIWEWCAEKLCASMMNSGFSPDKAEAQVGQGSRAKASKQSARNGFYYKLKPLFRYHSIGFRVVCAS
jgi:formylglycine-generating enzyme required for sulfatase activity